jgi:hypothetical protein
MELWPRHTRQRPKHDIITGLLLAIACISVSCADTAGAGVTPAGERCVPLLGVHGDINTHLQLNRASVAPAGGALPDYSPSRPFPVPPPGVRLNYIKARLVVTPVGDGAPPPSTLWQGASVHCWARSYLERAGFTQPACCPAPPAVSRPFTRNECSHKC